MNPIGHINCQTTNEGKQVECNPSNVTDAWPYQYMISSIIDNIAISQAVAVCALPTHHFHINVYVTVCRIRVILIEAVSFYSAAIILWVLSCCMTCIEHCTPGYIQDAMHHTILLQCINAQPQFSGYSDVILTAIIIYILVTCYWQWHSHSDFSDWLLGSNIAQYPQYHCGYCESWVFVRVLWEDVLYSSSCHSTIRIPSNLWYHCSNFKGTALYETHIAGKEESGCVQNIYFWDL